MDKCRIVTHDEIADDTSQRLVTLNTGRESVPELCTGRFSNGRALCFETSSTGYRHPSFKAECPYQRETSSYGNRGNRGMTKNKLQRKLCRDWTGVMLQKEDGVAHAHVKESRLNDETSLKADEVYP